MASSITAARHWPNSIAHSTAHNSQSIAHCPAMNNAELQNCSLTPGLAIRHSQWFAEDGSLLQGHTAAAQAAVLYSVDGHSVSFNSFLCYFSRCLLTRIPRPSPNRLALCRVLSLVFAPLCYLFLFARPLRGFVLFPRKRRHDSTWWDQDRRGQDKTKPSRAEQLGFLLEGGYKGWLLLDIETRTRTRTRTRDGYGNSKATSAAHLARCLVYLTSPSKR
jgi:hypothetical protein